MESFIKSKITLKNVWINLMAEDATLMDVSIAFPARKGTAKTAPNRIKIGEKTIIINLSKKGLPFYFLVEIRL